jgi:hypothetical protein
MNLDTGQVFPSLAAAAESVGVQHANISAAVRGVASTSGGYRWAYVDPESKPKKPDEPKKPDKPKSRPGMTIKEVQEEARRRSEETGKRIRYAHIQIEETLALAKSQVTIHKPKRRGKG